MEETAHIPLNSFQQWMQQMLLDPFQKTDVDPYTLLPQSSSEGSLEAVVNHSEKLSAKEHLAIYQRSYIARLRDCMAQQFSALEYALGEDLFCAFADDYLATHPSSHYNLAALGKQFPAYLEANRPDADAAEKEDWIDFMIELAQFEYDINILFEEQADEAYQPATQDSPEEAMELVPVCALFHFRFPIAGFYTAFKRGGNPDLPFEQESHSVVLRHRYKLAVYDLQPEQYKLLTYLKGGLSIPQAKAEFMGQNGGSAEAFLNIWPTWKERWIGANLFRVIGGQ